MATIGDIFTFTYISHKAVNPWPILSASQVVNYSWLSVSQGEMELFEEHPSTRGHLTSLKKQATMKAAWETFSTNT